MLAIDIWKRDRHKHELAVSNGYIVHIVWERDFKTNRIDVIEECVRFLQD